MGSHELLKAQNILLADQDKTLDKLEKSVTNLRAASVKVNEELNLQNRLLTDVADQVEAQTTTTTATTTGMRQYMRVRGNCWLYFVIVLLLAALVVLLIIS